MNSIRDGPRDQPRASAKRVIEKAMGLVGRATEAGRTPLDAQGPVPHEDNWEQLGRLLESSSPNSTMARAIKQGRMLCCTSARTFYGRQGQSGSESRAPPQSHVCCGCAAAPLKPRILPLGLQFASQPVLTAAIYCPRALTYVSTAVSASLGLSNAVG